MVPPRDPDDNVAAQKYSTTPTDRTGRAGPLKELRLQGTVEAGSPGRWCDPEVDEEPPCTAIAGCGAGSRAWSLRGLHGRMF